MRWLIPILLLLLVAASSAWGASFNVDSTADAVDAVPGDGSCATAAAVCSLRAAIQEANAFPGADSISLPAGIYILTLAGSGDDVALTGDLDITSPVVIAGANAGTTTVDGNAADRVFDVLAGGVADISGVTIYNGNVAKGAGVRNLATLILSDCILTGNVASADGGALNSEGATASVTVTDCELHTNQAKNGGGMFFKGIDGTIAITDVTLRDNTVTATGGGALVNDCNGSTSFTGVTFSGNSAVDGGGVLLKTSTAPSLVNVTVSGNTATNTGGGVRIESGQISLVNATVTANDAPATKGAGIHQSGGVIQLRNSLVAGNTTGNDCNGTMTVLGGNMDGDGTCVVGSTAAPLLGALQDNGGPTWTHALLPGSPAIDGGTNTGCPADDQRGVARPIDGDGDTIATCDIGAYETGAATVISGTVLEDVNGDAGLGDAVAGGNVRVRLYEDVNDNGQVDAGDTYIDETTTNATTGVYSFGIGAGSKFLVAVDSKTVPPSDGFNGGFVQADIWAEQTYGDNPSTPALDLGPRLGGRTAGTSEDVDAASTDPADNAYQHLARIDVSGGSVSGVDFAFSFRAVTHVSDSDDDLAENRTAQGSLRQLIQNANAIVDAPALDIPAGTYTLTLTGDGEDGALTGDLDVTDDVTLAGASPSTTVIDGNRTDRVFDVFAATVQFSDLTVEKGDSQGDHGGGILINAGSTLTLVDTMIRDNDGDRGGGIRVEGDLVMFGSTLYGNRGSQGGAIQASGSTETVTLTNVTISGNDATSRGGGVELDPTSLTNVTITGNTSADGGGIYRKGGQSFTVANSIVAGNPSGGDCSNAFTSAGYNLDGDGSCALSGPGDVSNGTANLGPLGDNGGSTLTHALLAGSDAIDAVAAGCPPPGTDQRGVARPLGARCDTGAFEAATHTLAGRVFEDADFAGTASNQGGSDPGLPNVDVELYSAADAYLTSTTTDATGDFAFGVTNGTYKVRVRSATIGDDPGGAAETAPAAGFNACVPATCAEPLPEMTWGNGSVLYGGQDPSLDDTATGDNGGPGDTWVSVTVNDADVAGVNFGFAYNLIVTTGDDSNGPAVRSKQGSLRQFIKNANAIGAASGTANSSEFRIPTNDTNYDAGTGVFTITLTSALPPLSDSGTTIDGTTQRDNVSDSNTTTGGNPDFAGKRVGTGPDGIAGNADDPLLPTYEGPEIEIDADDKGIILEIGASNVTLRHLAVFNNESYPYGIFVSAGTGSTIEQCFVGTRATGTDPGASSHVNHAIELNGGEADILDNFVAYAEDQALNILAATLIEGNDIYSNDLTQPNDDGIALAGPASVTIRRNRVDKMPAYALETWEVPGPYVVENNTFSRCGLGGGVEDGCVRVFGNGSSIVRNVVTGAVGPGIVVMYRDLVPANSTSNLISMNSIHANGGPGIDLDQTHLGGTPMGDGVTANDGSLFAGGQNQDIDYPILTSARLSGGSLRLAGYVGTAASKISGQFTIEAFVADDDGNNNGEIEVGDGLSVPHGEGKTYAGSCVVTTSIASPDFDCVIAVPPEAGLSVGSSLTTTSRLTTNSTSEFGANVTVDPWLKIVKRAFQLDGAPIASGSTVPAGMPVRFMLYIDNPGGAVADTTLQDVLDPVFAYQTSSMKMDNTLLSSVVCPGGVCDEAAIFTQVDGSGSALGDGDADADIGGYSAGTRTIDLGDGNNPNNDQLDLAAGRVWAVVFTSRMQ